MHEREQPLATILFGSRARGDYEERRSDIDIMVVQAGNEPDQRVQRLGLKSGQKVSSGQTMNTSSAGSTGLAHYGEKVQAMAKRYINQCRYPAPCIDGVIMTQRPETAWNTTYRDADDGETQYEYDWMKLRQPDTAR